MKKFEYDSFYFYAEDTKALVRQLDFTLGQEGWEVVYINRTNNDYDVIAKRELPQQEPWTPANFQNLK